MKSWRWRQMAKTYLLITRWTHPIIMTTAAELDGPTKNLFLAVLNVAKISLYFDASIIVENAGMFSAKIAVLVIGLCRVKCLVAVSTVQLKSTKKMVFSEKYRERRLPRGHRDPAIGRHLWEEVRNVMMIRNLTY